MKYPSRISATTPNANSRVAVYRTGCRLYRLTDTVPFPPMARPKLIAVAPRGRAGVSHDAWAHSSPSAAGMAELVVQYTQLPTVVR